MRNLALMWVLAGVALLSASLYVHSETIDSADVNLCFDIRTERPKLLFIKKSNDLKIQLTTEKFSSCDSSCWLDVVIKFDFIDGSGKSITFSGEYSTGVRGYLSIAWNDIDGRHRSDNIGSVMPPMIELTFSDVEYLVPERWYKKEDVLKDMPLFKNKIFTADMTVTPSPYWKPNLNTTYKFNFRVKITGECECDSIKERRK